MPPSQARCTCGPTTSTAGGSGCGARRVCYAIENFGYGMREFGVYDNNGYLLQFGQPLPEGAAIDCKE